MASEVAGTKPAGPNAAAGNNMNAARAARAKNANSGVVLTDSNRFALNSLLQASRGCKLLVASLRSGKTVSSDVVQAASVLAGAVASDMLNA